MAHKWNQRNRLVLLEEYAKHKKEFLCNGVKEDKIWKEIADEVRIKCSLDCSALECCDEIERLRLRYEINKSGTVTKTKMALFQYHAKCAFEIEENSEGSDKVKQTIKEEKIDPPSEMCPVTTTAFVSIVTTTEPIASITNSTAASFTAHSSLGDGENKVGDKEKQAIKEEKIDSPSELCSVTTTVPVSSVTTTESAAHISTDIFISTDSSSSSMEDFKMTDSAVKTSSNRALHLHAWPRSKIMKLLDAYKKYRTELTSPGVEKQSVWNKIAVEVRRKSKFHCDGLDCCKRIEELKFEYQRIENHDIKSRKMAYCFDKAKMILERNDDQVKFSAQQPYTRKLRICGRKNRDYRRKLLRVYANYKTEFLRPDIEEKRVWEKIAEEMREYFFYKCGGFLCRFDVLKLQRQYSIFKNTRVKENLPYFFYEAQQAFETAYNPDFRQTGVGNYSEESTFPCSNKRKHEQEQYPSTSYKNFTQTGVGNCSNESTFLYSNNRNYEEERNSWAPYKNFRQPEVGNCSNQSIFPYSNKRNHEEEQNPLTSYKKIATERRSWYFGGGFGSGS